MSNSNLYLLEKNNWGPIQICICWQKKIDAQFKFVFVGKKIIDVQFKFLCVGKN